MRLAKSSGTVMALVALLAWIASPLAAQAQPPAKAAQPSKPQPAKTSAAQAKAPAKAVPKTAAPGKGEAKGAKGMRPDAAKAGAGGAAPVRVARRDPFNSLVGPHRPGGDYLEHLPPGKAGLIISTLRVDGLVRGPSGMIAVVSNPQQRTYFLHEGDQLYDGRVEKISLETVAFHEVGKDAFGKPVERQVVKRLYPSPGEQR
jgi:hypothetical protein